VTVVVGGGWRLEGMGWDAMKSGIIDDLGYYSTGVLELPCGVLCLRIWMGREGACIAGHEGLWELASIVTAYHTFDKVNLVA